MQLHTTYAPARRKPSHIPESVVEFFAAQSKAVTLNSGSPDTIASMAGIYRFPITVSDFGEESEELAGDLKQLGFQILPDGTIRRADCLLYAVDESVREELRTDARVLWHQQNVEENESAAERLDQAGRGVGVRFEKKRSSGSIRDHVFDGRRR